MLGDNQKQDQRQSVKQIVQNQDSKIVVTCNHYSNSFIEALEEKLKFILNLSDGLEPEAAVINRELKKEQSVSLLQHQGHVTKVFCSLLAESTCKSPKNSGNRCYLLGIAPASASAAWQVPEDDDN